MNSQLLKYPIITLLVLSILLFACAGPQNRCQPPFSKNCVAAIEVWKNAINTIVLSSFPSEYGYYRAAVWEDGFNNAWVVKGREINITRQFMNRLSPELLVCVAAHELAHLKLGHYYSRIGVIIATEIPVRAPSHQQGGHYGQEFVQKEIFAAEGFGINQEEEADELALAYILNLGMDPNKYLHLLFSLQHADRENEPRMQNRIRSIKNIIRRKTPVL